MRIYCKKVAQAQHVITCDDMTPGQELGKELGGPAGRDAL